MQLIIDDAPPVLAVTTIQVYGNLSIGGRSCRMQSKMQITFMPDASLPATDQNLQGLWVSPALRRHGFRRRAC